MSKQEDINRVVEVLKTVPEKRLLIIELANSIPIKYGALDAEVLLEKQREVNLAVAEAKAYGSHTLMAVDALIRVPGRPAPVELNPLTDEDLEVGLQF